jgi:hypothetical protein
VEKNEHPSQWTRITNGEKDKNEQGGWSMVDEIESRQRRSCLGT